MSAVLNFQTVMKSEECCVCGVVFAMPSSLQQRLRESGALFYCPSGHPQHYSETEIQKLQKELQRVKESSQREIEWQRGARQTAEKQLIVKKGQITKLKNRISKGVCPCCNRSFANLHQHMSSKHPDYAAPEAE